MYSQGHVYTHTLLTQITCITPLLASMYIQCTCTIIIHKLQVDEEETPDKVSLTCGFSLLVEVRRWVANRERQ